MQNVKDDHFHWADDRENHIIKVRCRTIIESKSFLQLHGNGFVLKITRGIV